jgi:hypothetical protein
VVLDHEAVLIIGVVRHQIAGEVQPGHPHCHIKRAPARVYPGGSGPSGFPDDVDEGFTNHGDNLTAFGGQAEWGGSGIGHGCFLAVFFISGGRMV